MNTSRPKPDHGARIQRLSQKIIFLFTIKWERAFINLTQKRSESQESGSGQTPL